MTSGEETLANEGKTAETEPPVDISRQMFGWAKSTLKVVGDNAEIVRKAVSENYNPSDLIEKN
jgi:hypothetical protein